MSDHEDTSLDTGYSTPVPELDDHRHQSSSVQRTRSRRGTVDTMYGTSARNAISPDLSFVNRGLLDTVTRDFEEAVVDEESRGVSPLPPNRSATAPVAAERSRRGTVTTLDPRSVSPPNSVKAFADARRRERELSTTEHDTRRYEDNEHHPLHRTLSSGSRRSRRSFRSRRYTNENDDKSFAGSCKSAEEDVCFPLHDSADKDTLQIDFEILEDFIADEEIRDKTPPKNQPHARVFHDLRTQKGVEASTTIPSHGEVVEVPSASSSSFDEKETQQSRLDNFKEQHHPVDTNRFEFFSSVAESTIHAAELGDLVLPGESIRTLFKFPEGEEHEGVWWLNVNNPTEEEIRAICKAFRVHPLTIEDIGTQEAREKIELFPSYYFACFRSFNTEVIDGGHEYGPFNIYVIVFREGTLSFSFAPNPHAAHVRKRITMLKDFVSLSSDWICYALMLVNILTSLPSTT